jgi:hypothetical protein
MILKDFVTQAVKNIDFIITAQFLAFITKSDTFQFQTGNCIMAFNIELYERTVIFVQRIRPERGFESFSKYAETSSLLQNNIIDFSALEDADFGPIQDEMQRSVALPKINLKIVGNLEKLIIYMDDPNKTDKYLYEISKKFSEILVKEDIAAIGINFNGIIETTQADSIIKEKVLSKCPEIFRDADTASFKAMHNDGEAKLTISLDSGSINKKSEKREGILIACNYHREIKNQNLMKKKMNEFQDSLEQVKIKFENHKKKIENFLNG